MATWPKIVRDKPSVLRVAIASFVAVLVTLLWGPLAGIAVAVLALTGILLYTRLRTVREGNALAAADTFSFADVVVRMRAKDRARRLVDAQRRKEILAAH